MQESKAVATRSESATAFDLPDEAKFRNQMAAINRFQSIVHATMVQGHDYGVIPGTNKPTLLKPGAEKIAKLLGLSDTYAIMDRTEDWQKGFFRYIIKCTLSSGLTIVSEGIGECNSMESKYRWRWVFGSDVPEHIDKSKCYYEKRHSKKTGKDFLMYRLENDDVYSQVNTILKMAKKRALVDAALSAGRLSDLFTQDIEDIAEMETPIEPTKPSEPKPSPATTPTVEHKEAGEEMMAENGVNWILNSMKTLKWGFKDAIVWMVSKNLIPPGEYPKFSLTLAALSEDGMKAFEQEIKDRLAMSKPQ